MSTQHSKLVGITLFCFVSIVMILLVEFGGRIFYPHHVPPVNDIGKLFMYDSLLGWKHLPNQTNRMDHPDFSIQVRINSFGFRDDEYPIERNEKKRILVLGDSFGWGFGVEQKERFSDIIERRHPNWEIINTSVCGYSTDQQLLSLKNLGLKFKPDKVLLLFYENDFVGNVSAEQYSYFKPIFLVEEEQLKPKNIPVPHMTFSQKIKRFLTQTYIGRGLYPLYKGLKSKMKRKKRITKEGNNKIAKEGTAKRMNNVKSTTHLLLREMKRLSILENFEFLLISVPMSSNKRDRLKIISEKENIQYYPLDPYFALEKKPVTFPHDGHWNARGHSIAASAMEEFLHRKNPSASHPN